MFSLFARRFVSGNFESTGTNAPRYALHLWLVNKRSMHVTRRCEALAAQQSSFLQRFRTQLPGRMARRSISRLYYMFNINVRGWLDDRDVPKMSQLHELKEAWQVCTIFWLALDQALAASAETILLGKADSLVNLHSLDNAEGEYIHPSARGAASSSSGEDLQGGGPPAEAYGGQSGEKFAVTTLASEPLFVLSAETEREFWEFLKMEQVETTSDGHDEESSPPPLLFGESLSVAGRDWLKLSAPKDARHPLPLFRSLEEPLTKPELPLSAGGGLQLRERMFTDKQPLSGYGRMFAGLASKSAPRLEQIMFNMFYRGRAPYCLTKELVDKRIMEQRTTRDTTRDRGGCSGDSSDKSARKGDVPTEFVPYELAMYTIKQYCHLHAFVDDKQFLTGDWEWVE